MAKLVVITHEYDAFAYRRVPDGPVICPYLLGDLLVLLQELGHGVEVVRGPQKLEADAALLHVDSTVVGEEYLALRDHYPRTINFGVSDITKRNISRLLLLTPGDEWDGPVIVKADLNSQGYMEHYHNKVAAKEGRPEPHPGARMVGDYQVLERLADVDESVWSDPAWVVEKFIPEPDPQGGYVLRTWVFMGARERCTRMVTPGAISKASKVIRYEPVEVPPQLRAERERLNFDFGKFDFVMHEGEPILLDANKTPGVATAILPLMKKGAPNLAAGLEELITGEARGPAQARGAATRPG